MTGFPVEASTAYSEARVDADVTAPYTPSVSPRTRSNAAARDISAVAGPRIYGDLSYETSVHGRIDLTADGSAAARLQASGQGICSTPC